MKNIAKVDRKKFEVADQQRLMKRLEMIRTVTADFERRLASLSKKPNNPGVRLAKLEQLATTLWWVAYYTKLRASDASSRYAGASKARAALLEQRAERLVKQRKVRLRALNHGTQGHVLHAQTGRKYFADHVAELPLRSRKIGALGEVDG